jgi:NADPH:quinone reductase
MPCSCKDEDATMAKVVQLRTPGGVDRLEVAEVAVAAPDSGEIAVRQTAIGVNFIDIYLRTGLYPLATLPAVLGVEAAGVVTAVGADVAGLRVGDRIAYAGAVGAYASERLLPAWRAIPLPPTLTDQAAASALARTMTAHMLMRRVHAVGPDTVALVHGAAGGLGSLLTQWAKRAGATVIGVVGSAAKAAAAVQAGCDHVIVGRDIDLAAEVAALTGGCGVDVAYDGIGGAMLRKTLACVRPFGTVASIGQVAGPIACLDVEELGPRRSLLFARPSVMAYMSDATVYRRAAVDVMKAMVEGLLPVIGQTYALADAARAHADLEHGRTTGSVLLLA